MSSQHMCACPPGAHNHTHTHTPHGPTQNRPESRVSVVFHSRARFVWSVFASCARVRGSCFLAQPQRRTRSAHTFTVNRVARTYAAIFARTHTAHVGLSVTHSHTAARNAEICVSGDRAQTQARTMHHTTAHTSTIEANQRGALAHTHTHRHKYQPVAKCACRTLVSAKVDTFCVGQEEWWELGGLHIYKL